MKPSSGKERGKIDFNAYNLRPSGAYLDDMKTDLDSLLKSMQEADDAANALLKETQEKIAGRVPDGKTATAEGDPATLPKTKAEQDPKKPSLEELLGQLDSLVGLEKIKQNVRSLINLMKVRKLREENSLPVPPMSLHMVFMGNPGTGKTTVARIVAQLYCAIGVLTKGQLIEVDRSGLVAGFVGQTAIKTGDVIKSALGGVLFIDEAYSLAVQSEGGSNDFGHEAIETLLKAMEDNRGDLVVIVAGYENLMEKFISSNPGLESRFNRYLLFEDYNGGELFDIFSSLCGKNSYVLGEGAAETAKKQFEDLYETRDENFGNARHVRNVFENMVAVHADRVAAMECPTKDDLMTVAPEDVDKAFLMSQQN